MKKALLMSSSRMGNMGYLEHADSQIHHILQHQKITVLFIPYAGVTFSYDDYESRVKPVFEKLGYQLKSIHHFSDPIKAVKEAQAIAVGGGNTFALLRRLYDAGIVELINKRVVEENIPYLGWSAGSNVACVTIRTTNDMPIIAPPSLDGIGLLPFQLNPHFISGKPAGHNGESREERLAEFIAINPTETMLAIKEGSALYVEGDTITLLGDFDALHFKQNDQVDTIKAGQCFDVSLVHGPK